MKPFPMSCNRDYREKGVMRRLMVSDDDSIRDFDGRPATTSRVATRHGYCPAPTVLLDGKDRMLAKPVVGLTTVDYCGMYLDEAIDTAVAKVHASHRPAG